MNSSYINHFLQPDTIIPDYTNPQSWNRYAYAANNPIRYNDPTGHCFEPVSAVICIGVALGSMAAAGAYTYYNHGQDFNRGEYLTATGVGGLAGGLTASGLGTLAATGTTVAEAAFATRLISAGTAITVSGESYIRQNPRQFETQPFVVNTGISGTTAYLNSSPSTTWIDRLGISLVGAESNYLLTTNTQDSKQALNDMLINIPIKVGLSRIATESFNKLIVPEVGKLINPNSIREFAFPGRTFDSPKILSLGGNLGARDGLTNTVLGLFNGFQTGRFSTYIQNLIK